MLLVFDDNKLINYYVEQRIKYNLSVRELKAKIKNKEYERLDENTKNVKDINQNKTIGIIICKKDYTFVMEYCSDERIFRTTYILK